MEEDVSDINDDKNEKNDEEKEAECLDENSPNEMEEGVSDKKMRTVKRMMRERRLNA